MLAVPRSTAPLMVAAFRSAAVGVEIPTSSLMNSRIRDTEPPATAVPWLEPDSAMYMSFPLA